MYYRVELILMQEQRNRNGRLMSGMTRDSSPVYLVSPSGHTGRSPGPYTGLHPSQAHEQETFTLGRQYQNVPHCAPNFEPLGASSSQPTDYTSGPSSSQPTNYAHSTNPSYNLPDAEVPKERVISGAVNHTSESSDGESNRSGTNISQTATWYCADSGCPYKGPHMDSHHTHCIGCGRQRTWDSRREIIVTRDSPRPR